MKRILKRLIRKPMQIKNLATYNIPSYFLDILIKEYSHYLLAIQEKAVKEYGILNFNNYNKIKSNSNALSISNNNDHNLLVVAPPSSGKTLIGEMATIACALNQQKAIYLAPFSFMADDKYHHFNQLYASLGLDILISSQDRKEDDQKIIKGNYELAVIVYEKFNNFLLTYPDFLKKISLLIIDEIQIINDHQRVQSLKYIVEIIRNRKPDIKIIALSAFTENLSSLKEILSARLLTSFQRPIELRKGIVREGVFKYIEHNTKKTGKEEFFKAKKVRDNCFEDYLKETVNYFIQEDESTLLLFPTGQEAQEGAFFLSSHIDGPKANQAIKEFYHIKNTFSREKLVTLLEKSIAYYNNDLTREEKDLIEAYVKKEEIKVVCATTTLAMEIKPTFKNVILASEELCIKKEYSPNNYQESLSLIDIENIGGKAGILNKLVKDKTWCQSGKKEEFGRLIFLAHNKLKETIYKNLYFNIITDYHQQEEEIFIENYLMRETSNLPPTPNISSPPPRRGRTKVGVSLNTNDQRLTTIPSRTPQPVTLNSVLKTKNEKPKTVLVIDIHRPDKIIFEGKKIEVTAKEFSLIYLLAKNRGKILTHDDLINTIWKDYENATYVQITYHLYKIRRDILKTIGKNKRNEKKVKNIFKVVSRRGIILNLKENELEIN